MKSRFGLIVLVALLVAIAAGVGVWLSGGRGTPSTPISESQMQPPSPSPAAPPLPPPSPHPAAPVASAPPAVAPGTTATTTAPKTPATPLTAPVSSPPSAMQKPGGPVASSGGSAPPATKPTQAEMDIFAKGRQDIDNVSLMFRDFRTVMGQNPVGTNAEIMKAINGGNPKGARLMHEGQQLNGNGELVDSWGTPYFFHQMSATNMEITSAGPDRVFGTADDVKGR